MPSQSAFDAYHKWLGIPPKDQPPNHYRLLAIELFESDVEVIEAAANRQMAYVQQRATGEHAAISQKLLNELSAARVCLVNSRKKAAYDAKLKTKKSSPPASNPPPAIEPQGIERLLAEEQEGVFRQADRAAAPPTATDHTTAFPSPRWNTLMEVPVSAIGSVPTFHGKTNKKRKSRIPWAVVNVAGVVVIVLLIGLLVLKTTIEREIARKPLEASTSFPRARSEAEQNKVVPTPEWLPLADARKQFQQDRPQEQYQQDRRQEKQFQRNRPHESVRRVLPHNELQIVVSDAQVFNEKMANQFPVSQNKAGNGRLAAAVKAGGWGPTDAFSGSRTGHGCNLRAPGFFIATWAQSPTGRYILIFASTEGSGGKGSDPWNAATISVNGGRSAPLRGMACQTVAVIDLGQAVSIHSVLISIRNGSDTGITGLEIHEAMGK